MSNVSHVRVPSYENLALKDIFEQFEPDAAVFQYLPDGKELRKVPKQWICNVLATVVGEPFAQWVKARIFNRNETVIKERKLGIAMDADIAAAFHASTAISVSDLSSCCIAQAALSI